MIRNYFIVAWRNLLKRKAYTFINLTGLAVGIAACLLIFLIIQYETSFDAFHPNKDRIYRVSSEFKSSEGTDYSQGSSFPVAAGLRIDYPGLEKVAAICSDPANQITVETPGGTGTKKFTEDGIFFAEPEFFEMFDFPWLAGNPMEALSAPNTVALTQEMAEKYFGDWRTAIGKTLMYRNRQTFKVTGILKNVPDNTDFPLKIVFSFASHRDAHSTDWVTSESDLHTYVLLPPDMSASALNASLPAFAKRHKPAEYVKDGYILQPLHDIHFDERFGNFRDHTFSKSLMRALGLIGLFLLVIACVNFINLATAQAVKRAKEVGVRKVLGSSRLQLVFQFVTETFLITFFALVLAYGIAALFLPVLNGFMGSAVTLPFNLPLVSFLVLILFSVTLLAGFYPAMVLSGFRPITALQHKIAGGGNGSIYLRKALVILQFTISQMLIIGTLIVLAQMNFFKTAPMGFDKDQAVIVPIPHDSTSESKLGALKNRLLAQPGIRDVSFSLYAPSESAHWETDFKFDNAAKKTDFSADLKWADPDFFKMYKFRLAGRPYVLSDTPRELVVNESLLHKFGIRDPAAAIGKRIKFLDPEVSLPIVGVVEDFHSYSLEKPVAPVIIGDWKRLYRLMNVKIEGKASFETLARIKNWNENFPSYIYKFQFLDEKINNYYKEESRLSELYSIFTGIAILISCLGLYGLISFVAEQKRKEVGIRKVLGASVWNIVYLLSGEFTLPIVIAFLIAAPIGYYFMNRWLQNFAFRIEPGAKIFAAAFACSLIIAWITVAFNTVKAAIANPVKSLRTE